VRRKLIAVQPGTTIVREGDTIDAFFIVKSGRVVLYRERDRALPGVASVGPGEMFGLLAEVPRCIHRHPPAVCTLFTCI